MSAYVSPLTGHIDAAITSFIKRYRNNQFFSDILAPRVPAAKQSDRYWIWGKENLNLNQQTLREPGGTPQKITRSLSNVPFFCSSHALMAEIPDEDTYNTDPVIGDLRQAAAKDLMDKILLDKEVQTANLMRATANLASSNYVTLSGGSQWDAYMPNSGVADASAPGLVVEAGKAQIRTVGVRPGWIMAGDAVATALRHHPAVLDLFKFTNTKGNITDEQLANYFNVDEFYVGSAVVLDKNGSPSFVWGNDLLVGYTAGGPDGGSQLDGDGQPSASPGDLSAAKTFVWTGAPGTIGGMGTIIERKQPQASKADLVSNEFYYAPVLTAPETLYLIKNAVTGTLEI